jgi:hypothetical protein
VFLQSDCLIPSAFLITPRCIISMPEQIMWHFELFSRFLADAPPKKRNTHLAILRLILEFVLTRTQTFGAQFFRA